MNKKKLILIIIAVLVVLVIVGIWLWTRTTPDPEPPVVISPEVPTEEAAATGWSVKEDEAEAVTEAVSMMLEKLEHTPDIAFLYFPTVYQKEIVVKEARKLLPETTKLLGGTTMIGVMSDDGYFADHPQSMTILGVSVPEITWGVAAASAENVSPREAAKQAVKDAIFDAGKEETEKPDLIILVPTALLEEDIIRGIADAVGPEVPLFGTHVVDVGLTGKWGSFANDQIETTGVSLAVVYTDLKFGTALEAGFEITEKTGTITKADGLQLIEIDNRPAAEVYNEWLGGRLDEQIKNPKEATLLDILTNSVPDFLGIKTENLEGKDYFIPTPAINISPDLGLMIEIEAEEGDEIRLIRGDWEILLSRALTAPRRAIEESSLKKEDIIFALNSFCGATWMAIPGEEQPKIAPLLEEALGDDVPFAGVLACSIPIHVQELGRNLQSSLGEGVLIFTR